MILIYYSVIDSVENILILRDNTFLSGNDQIAFRILKKQNLYSKISARNMAN